MFDIVDAPSELGWDTDCVPGWDPAWDRDAWGESPERFAPASAPPSGELALALDHATRDLDQLAEATLFDAALGYERLQSWAAARQARVLDRIGELSPGSAPAVHRTEVIPGVDEFLSDHLAAHLGISRNAAAARLGQAMTLCRRLPAVLAAYESGELAERKVAAICELTELLDDEGAAAVAAKVLPRAAEQSPAQLRRSLRRAVLRADPDGARERHRAARKNRRVVVTPDDAEGMASLWALLSAPDAYAGYQHLTLLARSLGADDPRGMDARRADLLAELLTGRLRYLTDPADHSADTTTVPAPDCPAPECPAPDCPAPDCPAPDCPAPDCPAPDCPAPDCPAPDCPVSLGTADPGGATLPDTAPTPSAPPDTAGPPIRCGGARVKHVSPHQALIQVVVSRESLAGLSDDPAELAGYGPILPEIARAIAADAVWQRLVTDPLTGHLLDTAPHRYRPGAALDRHVRARDQRCRFPLCNQPVATGDLDHVVPFPAGATVTTNLIGLCRRHHRLKTRGQDPTIGPGWTVRTLDEFGALEWTSPTGHTHRTWPHDYTPDDPHPSGPPPSAPRPAQPVAPEPVDLDEPPPF